MEKWPIDSYYSNALWKSIIKYFNFVLFKGKKSFRACLNAFCQMYSRKNGLNFDRLRFVKLAANYERYAYVVTRSCFHTLFISNRLCLYSDTFLSCLLAFSPNKSRQLRLLNYDNTKKRKNKQSENSKRMQLGIGKTSNRTLKVGTFGLFARWQNQCSCASNVECMCRIDCYTIISTRYQWKQQNKNIIESPNDARKKLRLTFFIEQNYLMRFAMFTFSHEHFLQMHATFSSFFYLSLVCSLL